MNTLNEKDEKYTLSMKYLKVRNREDELRLKSLKLNAEVQIESNHEDEYEEVDELKISCEYYNIDIDSINSVQLFENSDEKYDIFLELRYMPQKFLCTKIQGYKPDGEIYVKKFINKRLISKFFKDDFLVNSCYNQPILKLTGEKTQELSLKF